MCSGSRTIRSLDVRTLHAAERASKVNCIVEGDLAAIGNITEILDRRVRSG